MRPAMSDVANRRGRYPIGNGQLVDFIANVVLLPDVENRLSIEFLGQSSASDQNQRRLLSLKVSFRWSFSSILGRLILAISARSCALSHKGGIDLLAPEPTGYV